MNVVLVNRFYPPHTGYGGIAMYQYYLAHALSQLGHRVIVISSRHATNVPEKEMDRDVVVYRLLKKNYSRLSRVPGLGRFVRPLGQLFYSFKISRLLTKLEQTEKIDVIEFADIEAEGFAYLLKKKRKQVVVRCHTPTFILKKHYSVEEIPYDINWTCKMEKFCIQKADMLTAPSKSMLRTIEQDCSVQKKKAVVIPNALGTADFSSQQKAVSPSNGRIKVLHVGRLERVKGVEVLAKAIPMVLKEAKDAEFLFAGPDLRDSNGTLWSEKLKGILKEEHSRGQVRFLGRVEQADLMHLYAEAHIAVIPSINYESFSYTCAQAMAAGLPVVATRIGGIPETVEESQGGVLVNPGDSKELAEAIIRLTKDEKQRTKLGKFGYEKARREFDALNVAKKTHEAYEVLIEKS